MILDKELYRKAYAALGEWKKREVLEQLLAKRNHTPQQDWEDYIGLWELAVKLSPTGGEYQHAQHIKDWEDYYTKIQKLQAWMKAHGKTI